MNDLFGEEQPKLMPCSVRLRHQAEALYKAYPKKAAKLYAIKCIIRALGRRDFDTLMAGVKRYALYHEAKGTEREFLLNPATFFNRGEYDTVYPEVADSRNIVEAPDGKYGDKA